MPTGAQGGTLTLFAQYQNGAGGAVNPTTPLVSILDPTNNAVINSATPVYEGSTGRYSYDFEIPEDAPIGSWTAVWSGVINGSGVEASEVFQVAEAGDIVFPGPDEFNIIELRYRIDERKTILDGDGAETFFTDEFIEQMLLLSDENMDVATYSLWRMKMAKLARLIDITESGSDRNLNQRFKNAQAMVKVWKDAVESADAALASAVAGRVVGKVVNLRGTGKCDTTNPYPFSGYSDYVRIFPSHRLMIYPAVLS